MARVLISGASVAGPVLAYWLHRFGFETTVVERTRRCGTASVGTPSTCSGRVSRWYGGWAWEQIHEARTRPRS